MAQDYKEKHNSTPNKSQTQRSRAYEGTSFLSTYCELSINPCSRFLYSIRPRCMLCDSLKERQPSIELGRHLGVEAIEDVIQRRRRLRWHPWACGKKGRCRL